MATRIGNLNVVLRLQSQAFHSGVKQATSALRGFSASTVAAGNIMSTAFVSAIRYSINKMREFADEFKESAKRIDELAKTARKLGTSTGGLAGLRYAAEVSGAGIRTLDMGLQRMTRRISEAAAGTGEAKDAIKELGLDAVALNRMGPEQAFRRIAEAMNRVNSQSDRVRLAFKLFDSEGVALVNTLALGTREMNRLQAEAERFGVAVNRVDAEKVEKMNDAVTRMKLAFKGAYDQVVIEFAPTVERMLRSFTDNFQRIRRAIADLIPTRQDIVEYGIGIARVLDSVLLGARIQLERIKDALRQINPNQPEHARTNRAVSNMLYNATQNPWYGGVSRGILGLLGITPEALRSSRDEFGQQMVRPNFDLQARIDQIAKENPLTDALRDLLEEIERNSEETKRLADQERARGFIQDKISQFLVWLRYGNLAPQSKATDLSKFLSVPNAAAGSIDAIRAENLARARGIVEAAMAGAAPAAAATPAQQIGKAVKDAVTTVLPGIQTIADLIIRAIEKNKPAIVSIS